ncbi:MAG: permease-like cell division protein FtsX [Bdellovibrionales bacterium]|nr:permease-like cell division protein FtsX [Bdellovibrionales bacterium]
MNGQVLLYLIQTALRSFKRHMGLHFVSILTMVLVFFLVGGGVLFFSHAKKSLVDSTFDLQISAYLDHAFDSTEQKKFVESVCKDSFIESCEYVSRDDAKKAFLKSHQELGAMLEVLKKNPFPPSFEIKLLKEIKASQDLESLSTKIKRYKGVSDVDDGGVWLKKWIDLFQLINRCLALVGFLFLIAMVFVIANTMRLVVHSRRDELEIQTLIGATKAMIRFPFLLEGFIEGFLASVFALAMLAWAHSMVNHEIASSWSGLFSSKMSFFSYADMGVFLVSGIAVGCVGSFFAIEKYIRS